MKLFRLCATTVAALMLSISAADAGLLSMFKKGGEFDALIDERLGGDSPATDGIETPTPSPELERHAPAPLPDLPGFAEASLLDDWVVVDSADTDALVHSLVGANVDFRDLEIEPVSLEEAVVTVFRDDRTAGGS